MVAATPISGPQFIPIVTSDWRASEEVIMLTTDIILHPAFLAVLTALSTSALSPLCDMATSTEPGPIPSDENCISLDMTASVLFLAWLAKKCFATSAAL